MFSKIKEFFINLSRSRHLVLLFMFGLMFFVLIIRVFYLQIIKNEYYLNNYIQTSEKTIYTPGARGNIYDRNGNVLAYNELAYAVTIEDILPSGRDKAEKLNKIICEAIMLIEKNGDKILYDFPVVLNEDQTLSYSYAEGDGRIITFLCNVFGMNSIKLKEKGLDQSTPQEVYNYLCSEEGYNLNSDYKRDEKLKIISVRYNLSLNAYKKYVSTVIAQNVRVETVAAIYENKVNMDGVEIEEKTIRKYNDSFYFSSILGYTGEISESQLMEFDESGIDTYFAGDIVGKAGLESVLDDHLFGTRGEETVFVDNVGRIIDTMDSVPSIPGRDIYLTLDRDLQIAVYNILEQKIAGILISKIVNYDVVIDSFDDEKLIGIKDIYFQMINNNVADPAKFNHENSGETEKRVYNKYVAKRSSAISTVEEHLSNPSSPAVSNLNLETKSYVNYVYSLLGSPEVGILDKSEIDMQDQGYKDWASGNISLREFLRHALANNWINLSKLDSDYTYANSNEVYDLIVDTVVDLLVDDTGFSKQIYYYLIKNGTVTGNEVCLILFEQGVLEYNEDSVRMLSGGGGGTAYSFMIEQLKNRSITPAQVALDPCSGSCTLIDPNTGDVLAMVSYPSYDNNMLSGKVDSEYWKKINSDLSLPLYNRATQARIAPGSTFKMVAAAAGLEEGAIDPWALITDQSEFTKITPSPKCWIHPGSHGTINVTSAIAQSCNYFFYEVGWRLGITSSGKYSSEYGLEKIEKYATLFGLTTKSGIEIEEENMPRFSDENAVLTSIGQGTNNYSGVQLARYASTLANKGTCFNLSLLEKSVNNQEETEYVFENEIDYKSDFKESTWEAINNGMRQVITSGTASWIFNGSQIEIAGKSGTAQENRLRSNHSLFVSYAPANEPVVSASVVIPFGGSSSYAGEVTRDVMNYYFGYTTLEEVINCTAADTQVVATTD